MRNGHESREGTGIKDAFGHQWVRGVRCDGCGLYAPEVWTEDGSEIQCADCHGYEGMIELPSEQMSLFEGLRCR